MSKRSEHTEAQLSWDGIREILGQMPLYSGYMLEKDGDQAIKPKSGLERLQTKRRHRCPFCNVNAMGQHQDFCPEPNAIKQVGRQPGTASKGWPMNCKKQLPIQAA